MVCYSMCMISEYIPEIDHMKNFFLLVIALWSFYSTLSASNFYHNVLSAAKDADSFIVVKINEQRQDVAQYMLPHSAKIIENNQLSTKLVNLNSGTYIFPVKSGEVLSFSFPNLKVENAENVYSLLLRFKQLQIKDEASFLICNLLNQHSAIRFAALKRMQENGFFNSSFDKNAVAFFKEFYTKNKLSVPEKRLLLETFAICNFNQMTDIYILALSDSPVSKLSGKIFYAKNRVLFSSIIKKHISNEKLCNTALKQSEFFIEDEEFVNKAMKWCDRRNPQKISADFIPLLFAKTRYNYHNESIIKGLLTSSKNTKSFELYYTLAYWLNHSHPDKYKDEVMQFVVNNKRNRYISESIVYPMMLSALKKSGHAQANKLLLEYLEKLKQQNNKQLADQVCILFKKTNKPNPTLDELINSLK